MSINEMAQPTTEDLALSLGKEAAEIAIELIALKDDGAVVGNDAGWELDSNGRKEAELYSEPMITSAESAIEAARPYLDQIDAAKQLHQSLQGVSQIVEKYRSALPPGVLAGQLLPRMPSVAIQMKEIMSRPEVQGMLATQDVLRGISMPPSAAFDAARLVQDQIAALTGNATYMSAVSAAAMSLEHGVTGLLADLIPKLDAVYSNVLTGVMPRVLELESGIQNDGQALAMATALAEFSKPLVVDVLGRIDRESLGPSTDIPQVLSRFTEDFSVELDTSLQDAEIVVEAESAVLVTSVPDRPGRVIPIAGSLWALSREVSHINWLHDSLKKAESLGFGDPVLTAIVIVSVSMGIISARRVVDGLFNVSKSDPSE